MAISSMFVDGPAVAAAGGAGAASGGGATCGNAGGTGAAGFGTPGAPAGGVPGLVPAAGSEIIRVYSLGPCPPPAGEADGFTGNACVAPPPWLYAAGVGDDAGGGGAGSITAPVPNMRV